MFAGSIERSPAVEKLSVLKPGEHGTDVGR